MEYLQYVRDIMAMYDCDVVLNLIINGIPSILPRRFADFRANLGVLNLIINGIPSILHNGRQRFITNS